MNKLAFLVLLTLIALNTAAFSQTRKPVARRSRAARTAKPKSAVAAAPASAATTTASGLTYLITERGTGKQLKAGDTVFVNYTGLLTNGIKFDSSLDRGQPFPFELGAGKVIKGWDEGIQKLRVGDRATLIIPPALGYGARGAGVIIPPNATLIFIVEVMNVR